MLFVGCVGWECFFSGGLLVGYVRWKSFSGGFLVGCVEWKVFDSVGLLVGYEGWEGFVHNELFVFCCLKYVPGGACLLFVV